MAQERSVQCLGPLREVACYQILDEGLKIMLLASVCPASLRSRIPTSIRTCHSAAVLVHCLLLPVFDCENVFILHNFPGRLKARTLRNNKQTVWVLLKAKRARLKSTEASMGVG